MFGKDVTTAIVAGVANTGAYQYVSDMSFQVPTLALSDPSLLMGLIGALGVLVINVTWEEEGLSDVIDSA